MRPLPFLIALAALAAGCVDPIDLGIEREGVQIVVQGAVMEGPGPHSVEITEAAAFGRGIEALQARVRGARVSISVDGAPPVPLAEVGPGVHTTSFGDIVGRAGRAYALRVELPDGRVFTSAPETMRAAPPIQRAYTEYVSDTVLVNQTLVARPSYDLLVDIQDPAGEENYYRLTWERGEFRAIVRQGLESEVCYFTTKGGTSRLEVSDDEFLDGELLVGRRVDRFRLVDTPGLDTGYYQEIVQGALTEPAFAYFAALRETRSRVGGLFDPPPLAVNGNVSNAADSTDIALGYFAAIGTSRGSTCTRLSDFPDRPPLGAARPPVEAARTRPGLCVRRGGSTTPSPEYVAACSR